MTAIIPTTSVNPDVAATDELVQFLSVLAIPDQRIVTEGQKTALTFRRFAAEMEARFRSISEENRLLRERLVGSESRQREIEAVHSTELVATSAESETLRQELVGLRQELQETRAQTNEQMTALLAAHAIEQQASNVRILEHQQTIATLRQELETSAQRTEQRIAALITEKDAAVLQAKEAGKAQVAIAREEERREANARIARLVTAHTLDLQANNDQKQKFNAAIKPFLIKFHHFLERCARLSNHARISEYITITNNIF